MDKRYQVFISSTYADLKEERSKVIQTIMELDCIPAGMEIFPAIDEEQFNFIKSIIDDCDYYLLIIGGRYGSLSDDGLSYTEKEYNYAIEKGIKVIAFIHDNPESIPLGKSEKDSDLREKLELFKRSVSTGRLIKHWRTAEELPGLVALSLSKTIKTYPAIGWVRATLTSNVELLEELNQQRKENQELKIKIQSLDFKVSDKQLKNLAGLDDIIEVKGSNNKASDRSSSKWNLEITWSELFQLISPYLMDHPNDQKAEKTFSEVLFKRAAAYGYSPLIDKQIYQTINIRYTKTSQGGMGLFWSLTQQGEQLMYELLAVKRV
jgi:hypothetical protein